MFCSPSELHHQVPTDTLQPTTTERCPEGHEKGQPGTPVLGR